MTVEPLIHPVASFKWSRWLPWAAAAAGVVYVVMLQMHVRPGLFYTCDAGLKYVQVQQWLRGGPDRWRLDVDMPAEAWVRELWNDGLYPFDPPFVIHHAGKHFINYPPFFAWMSAPFAAMFGYRGLYVVPIAAVLAVWWTFGCAARRLAAGPILAAAGLAMVAIASPLTLYSATFWEHTLGIALAWPAVARLIVPPLHSSSMADVCRGVLLGLSGWFRPELLLLTCLVSALVLARRSLLFQDRSWIAFVCCACTLAGGTLIYNQIVSGAWLGFRGMQIGARGTMFKPLDSFNVLQRQFADFAEAFPVIWLFLLLGLDRLIRRATRADFRRTDLPLLMIGAVQVALLVLIFPTDGGYEWSPRYHLMAVPAMTLLMLRWIQCDRIDSTKTARLALAAAVSIVLAMGMHRNVLHGLKHMTNSYKLRVEPMYAMVKSLPARVVAVTNQCATMELTNLLDDKRFFGFRTIEELSRLASATYQQRERFIIVITSPQATPIPEVLPFTVGTVRAKVTFKQLLRGWSVIYLGHFQTM